MRAARVLAIALACAAVVAFLLLRRSGTDAGRNPAATSEGQPRTPTAGPSTPAPAVPTPRAAAKPSLPAVQPQVTADAFAACRKRVRQVPVRPDWEMAEASASGGHRVIRVSMFGKSMTGFHEVDGRWLADALWCLPIGLP